MREIIDEEGNLLYRRILSHSHVNEQPFVRSGGPVDIAENSFIYIRGHMNTNGYGTKVFSGTITDGLKEDFLEEDFAIELAEANPQPSECVF